MKSFKHKTIILLFAFIGLTFVVIGAYAFFFMVMADKTLATADLASKITQISEKNISQALLSSSLKSERVNIEKLSSYFIKEQEIVSFTKKIESLGKESETVLTIESLEPKIVDKKNVVLNFTIKATGSFENIMHLIILLENFPAKFEWRTVSITREDSLMSDTDVVKKNSLPAEWRATFSLTAFNFIQ